MTRKRLEKIKIIKQLDKLFFKKLAKKCHFLSKNRQKTPKVAKNGGFKWPGPPAVPDPQNPQKGPKSAKNAAATGHAGHS